MITRRAIAWFLPAAAIGSTNVAGSEPRPSSGNCDHVAWVERSLSRMKQIQAGMTREELLAVFTTEGGLSTGLRRTFVSQDCPYFKVDVDFKAIGRPEIDEEGRATLIEDPGDVIVRISRPYLEFSVAD